METGMDDQVKTLDFFGMV